MQKSNGNAVQDDVLKFRFYEFINRHHKITEISEFEIKKQLASEAGVSLAQLYRWMKIKKDEQSDLKYQQIKAIAQYFGVTIDLLYNA